MALEDTTLGAGESRRHGSCATRNRLMPPKKNDDQKLADRATDLYWDSPQSVNQIAETMDLSKSGLYALIRPLPAERACPECGEGLVFPNRTAKQKGIGSCLGCEYLDGAQPASKGTAPDAARRSVDTGGSGAGVDPAETGTDLEPTGPSEVQRPERRTLPSSRVLWGVVLLGLAAGLYATRRSR